MYYMEQQQHCMARRNLLSKLRVHFILRDV